MFRCLWPVLASFLGFSLPSIILASSNFVQLQPKIQEVSFLFEPYHQGHSVALSNDGKTIAVSVPGFLSGDVFVYSWNDEQQKFLQSGVLDGTGSVGTDGGVSDILQLGYVVAINGDGSTIFFSRTDASEQLGCLLETLLVAGHNKVQSLSVLIPSTFPDKDHALNQAWMGTL